MSEPSEGIDRRRLLAGLGLAVAGGVTGSAALGRVTDAEADGTVSAGGPDTVTGAWTLGTTDHNADVMRGAQGQYLGGSAQMGYHAEGVNAAWDAFMAHLTHGYGHASMGLTGDSTNADPDGPAGSTHRWYYRLVGLLVAAYPNVYWRYRDFNAGLETPHSLQWQAPVVLNAPAGVQRTHYSLPRLGGHTIHYQSTPALDQVDIDVAVEVALASWQGASGTILARCAPTTLDYTLLLNTDGTVMLRWHPPGGDSDVTVRSTAPVPSPGAGVPIYVRAQLKCDTGNGTHTITFSTSPTNDAFSWTTLGAKITVRGTTAVSMTPGARWELGGRLGGPPLLAGDFYECWIRHGIAGALIAPVATQDWDVDVAPTTMLAGGPCVDVFNAAWPGKSIVNTFDNPTYAPMMSIDSNTLLWFVSTSHNDGQLLNGSLLDAWEQLVSNHRYRMPKASIAAINQNPSITGSSNMPMHPVRANQLASICRCLGVSMVDTFRFAYEDGRPWSTMLTGQHHPIDTGNLNQYDVDGAVDPVMRQAQIVYNAMMSSPFAVVNSTSLVRGG